MWFSLHTQRRWTVPHILHHVEHTEDQLREILQDFMLLHIEWVTSLTSTVHKYTQVPVKDYIDSITTPGVPLDFVGLMVFAAFSTYMWVCFFNNGCWCTSHEKDLSKARFGIVFHGDLKFTETVHKGWSEKYLFWIQTRQAQGKMPSHNNTHVPGLLKH